MNIMPFNVFFNRPVCLEENKKYKLDALIKGPVSWCGKEGRTAVECEEKFHGYTCAHVLFSI